MNDSGRSNGIQDGCRTTTLRVRNCIVNTHRPVLSREDRARVEEQIINSMLLLAEAAEEHKETGEAV